MINNQPEQQTFAGLPLVSHYPYPYQSISITLSEAQSSILPHDWLASDLPLKTATHLDSPLQQHHHNISK